MEEAAHKPAGKWYNMRRMKRTESEMVISRRALRLAGLLTCRREGLLYL